MEQMFNLVGGILLVGVVGLGGCAKGGDAPTATTALSSPDAEVLALVATAKNAQDRVGQMISDAVLRQVDCSPSSECTFRFTDSGATQGITIFAYSSKPPEQWRLVREEPSPLIGYPSSGLDLQALVIGPGSAESQAAENWQTGSLRHLSLSGERRDLYWHVFWNLSEGVASGTVDARTGVFTPSSAPPAMPPPSVPAR